MAEYVKPVDKDFSVIYESDIIVDVDKDGVKYTNESILEYLENRSRNVIPKGIEEANKYNRYGSSGLPSGAYEKPIGTFNVGKACAYIASKAYSQYIKGLCGKCAAFVRRALEAGGINTEGHPVSAYQYASFLPSKGFKKIMTLATKESQLNFTKTQAHAGDVAVMAHGQHGHICLFDGDRWVSDFKQNNIWVYGGNGVVEIFRFTP